MKDNKKKKLLFISSNLKAGGIQNVLSNLSESLTSEYDLSILLDSTEGMVFKFHGEIISLGGKHPSSYNNLLWQFGIFIKRLKFLIKHRREYDYVISVKDSAHLPNVITKKRGGKTVIAVYCNVLSMANVSWAYKYIILPMARFMYNMADLIIVTSDGVKNQLKALGIDDNKMVVIYDGVNVSNIDNRANEELSNEEKALFAQKKVICALGRLDPVKGFDYLIKVISIIAKEIPDIMLLIMGTGGIRDNLENLVKQYNVENNVKLMGFVENPYKYIRNSQAFVMSSIAEGFPTVLMEAMVCGTPIISTDMESGAREILAPNTDIAYKNLNEIEFAEYGVLVPVFKADNSSNTDYSLQEEVMAKGIMKMLSDKEKQNEYKEKYGHHRKDLSHVICAQKWCETLDAK